MNSPYPHVDYLLEAILKYPSDSLDYADAAEVIDEYTEDNAYGQPADPTGQALRAELAVLLAGSDEALISVVGTPGTQTWEHGVPEIGEIRDFFGKYIAEIDRRHKKES